MTEGTGLEVVARLRKAFEETEIGFVAPKDTFTDNVLDFAFCETCVSNDDVLFLLNQVPEEGTDLSPEDFIQEQMYLSGRWAD